MICFVANYIWNWSWSSSHFSISHMYSNIVAFGTGISWTNFLTDINEPDNSLQESKPIDKKFWSIFLFLEKAKIAFNQQTSFFQLLFLYGTLGKVFIVIKSCNHSSLHIIMHLWFKNTSATSFLDMYQSRPENFSCYSCLNSLVNVILPHFLQFQDFFYILASLVQIQEMMLWSMLAIISTPCSSDVL